MFVHWKAFPSSLLLFVICTHVCNKWLIASFYSNSEYGRLILTWKAETWNALNSFQCVCFSRIRTTETDNKFRRRTRNQECWPNICFSFTKKLFGHTKRCSVHVTGFRTWLCILFLLPLFFLRINHAWNITCTCTYLNSGMIYAILSGYIWPVNSTKCGLPENF